MDMWAHVLVTETIGGDLVGDTREYIHDLFCPRASRVRLDGVRVRAA